MSHHSSRPDPEIAAMFDAFVNRGATGKYPEGHLTKQDEGEIQFAVAVLDGKVVVEFGKSVRWLGMNPDQARVLGELLIQRATDAVEKARVG